MKLKIFYYFWKAKKISSPSKKFKSELYDLLENRWHEYYSFKKIAWYKQLWLQMSLITLFIFIFTGLSLAVYAYNNPSITTGNPLYSLKKTIEKVEETIIIIPVKKAEFYLNTIEKREKEIKTMENKNQNTKKVENEIIKIEEKLEKTETILKKEEKKDEKNEVLVNKIEKKLSERKKKFENKKNKITNINNSKATSSEEKDIKKNNKNDNDILCTMEAKMCSDGTYVGRVAPKCDFSLCPNEIRNNIKKEIDKLKNKILDNLDKLKKDIEKK